ncbi:MAG: hypothetical protein CVV09_12830 [Gammaproteobacteria bacterium HGW-Gammaproteobacteria-13]|nr:MAG: hypothetical protein CVV09_12830 [Gammaproteobacteria bacterium HGW-Gammaproteobacteria-13]
MRIDAGATYPVANQRASTANQNRSTDASFSAALASTPSSPPKTAASADFSSMTRQDLRDWTNGQIRSGQMSLDDSRAFMAMSMKIPVAGGMSGELPAANDSTRYDFTQKARAGMEGAAARNDAATLKMLQSAMSIMQSQTGSVDIRA